MRREAIRAVAGMLGFLVPVLPLWADVEIRMVVGGDEITRPGRASAAEKCEPCGGSAQPGEIITIRAQEQKARRDRGEQSVILRKDRKKLFFVCHRSRQYSELRYPVNVEKYGRSPGRFSYADLQVFNPVGSTKRSRDRVREWPVEKFEGTFANGLREQFRILVAVLQEPPEPELPVLELRGILNDLERSGSGWTYLLPFHGAIPAVWEEAQRQPETEFIYREEASEVRAVNVPPEVYDVPEGYRKVRFSRACWQLN